jgi:hypothetical protein
MEETKKQEEEIRIRKRLKSLENRGTFLEEIKKDLKERKEEIENDNMLDSAYAEAVGDAVYNTKNADIDLLREELELEELKRKLFSLTSKENNASSFSVRKEKIRRKIATKEKRMQRSEMIIKQS